MAFDWGSFLGTNLGAIFKDVVGSFKADPTVALQVQEKLAESQMALQGKILDQISAQVQVDLAEAQSKNWFVAGWRPAVGWVSVIGLLYQFLIAPLGTAFSTLAHHAVTFPTLDMTTLLSLLGGMLGLGITGTVEKVTNGNSTAH
jgi:hypothetical protein